MSKVIGATVGTTYDKSKIGGSGLTAEQQALLEKLAEWDHKQNYKQMTVSFISGASTTCEMGSSHDIYFKWKFTQNVSSVTFNGEEVDATMEGGKWVNGITKTSSYKVIGTRADGDKETADATATVSFLNKRYYGCAAMPAEVNSNFIRGLTSEFASSLKKDFSGYCSSGQYIWYAYPKRFGKAKFYLAPKGTTNYNQCDEEPSTVSVTNGSGYPEDYYVYRNYYTGQQQEVRFL